MSLKISGTVLIASLTFVLALTAGSVQAKSVVTIPVGTGTNTTSSGYSPATITVIIGVNNTVTWINGDTSAHTVTSDGGVFDSGMLNANQTFVFTFDKEGQYPYHCAYHSWMHGTVIVRPATAIPEFPVGSLAPVLLVSVVVLLLALRRVRGRTPVASGTTLPI